MAATPADFGGGWVAPADTRHERLVWLAARPELVRIHRRWWHGLAQALAAPAPMGADGYAVRGTDREHLTGSLEQAAFIVDELAGDFIDEERDLLRRTGELPRWFWPTYRQKFEAARGR